MLYEFICDVCGTVRTLESRPFRPPENPTCQCKKLTTMRRIYSAVIDTSGCQDVDSIPAQHMLCPRPDGMSKSEAEARTRRYQQSNQMLRRQIAEGGKKEGIKQSHAIPPELYHGKIKQTGDKNYWRDSKNLDRHKSCRVDNGYRNRRGRGK
jgi:hypothetical protein